MTRRGDGEAQFSAGGETYRLKFDFNALADYESIAGAAVWGALDRFAEGEASAEDMRAMLWACLQEHHTGITLREAGRLMSEGQEALSQAMDTALAAPSAEEESGEPQAATSPAA
ncbi:tail tube GTA-gp10-like protein [Gemmobacter caeni]|uniref:Tail tube GTA-gp10-like protein n=1 Tax=Gemmobacter caeni TaxID=589035 RepID=A0A2T6A5H1_9RHOB|nr:GTA-gp10 family protein [Gemmobacter caeni]PTX39070.1 tail tube GTA-gp10-like protein [Gemmobacter caeni]TWJ05759.1 tail tube GTA-gp10-like protein [Gemmobacter caeni]